MTTRRVVVANTQRVKAALLVPATRRDSFRLGATWQGVGDYSTWEYNRQVEAIQQFPKNGYEVGDTLEVYDFTDRLGATMKIEQIKMIVCADITDGDIRLLGYVDRDEWMEQTEGGLVERKAWLLVGPTTQHQVEGPPAAAGVIKTTNVETGESQTIVADLRDHPAQ